MKINNGSAPSVRTDQSRDLQASRSGGASADATRPTSPVQRSDRVQISDAGRALAAQATSGTRGELSVERIAEVRERVLSGAYDSLDIVDQVARRVLQS